MSSLLSLAQILQKVGTSRLVSIKHPMGPQKTSFEIPVLSQQDLATLGAVISTGKGDGEFFLLF